MRVVGPSLSWAVVPSILAGLLQNSTLQSLHLKGNRICASGAAALAKVVLETSTLKVWLHRGYLVVVLCFGAYRLRCGGAAGAGAGASANASAGAGAGACCAWLFP